MDMFFIDHIPPNAMEGVYSLSLVFLSYIVAVFGAFTALTLASRLHAATGAPRILMHIAGAFALGGGIWSMHFIGMLAWRMDMPMTYDTGRTILSMAIAVACAGAVMQAVRLPQLRARDVIGGGLWLGIGICSMHYIGMSAMKMHAELHYLPVPFALSALVAIAASASALWIVFRLSKNGESMAAIAARVLSSLLIGAGVCGMHYMGMEAAVFIPDTSMQAMDMMHMDGIDINIAVMTITVLTTAIFGFSLVLMILSQENAALKNKDNFPVRLLSASLLITVVSVLWVGGYSYGTYKTVMKDLIWRQQVAELSSRLDSINDALTKDSRDFVLTGEMRWLDQYTQDKKIWDESIDDLNAGFSNADETDAAKEIKIYGDELSKMESQAMQMAHQGKRDSALKIIGSHDYAADKEKYSDNIWKFYGDAESKAQSRAYIMADNMYASIYFAGITASLLGVLWFFCIRSLGRWRQELETTRNTLALRISEKERMEERMKKYIDDIRAAHSRAMKAIDEAERANNAKSEFLANMSHELRTPMNGIIGLNELLLDMGLNKDQKELAEAVQTSSRNLLILLNDILDISKIEGGELTLERIPFDLHRAISETIGLLKPIASRKRVVLDRTVNPLVPARIMGDPTRLQQILTNLIGNAIKFTEAGYVRLDVTYSHDKEDRTLLHIRVEDTGIGIAEDKHEMIFSKFTQADLSTARKYGGTGLGLAITRHLVEIMGGTIRLASAPGKGTTFYVDLPVEPLAADSSAEDGTGFTQSSFKTDVSLLVVDDHPVNLLFMRKVLKKLGFAKVDEARSGAEALDILKSGGHYDLILMDCQMPEMDGFEASQRIRAGEANGNTHTNIVAITADAMKGAREKCLAAGMNDYISKPIDIEKMRAVLSTWLPGGSGAGATSVVADNSLAADGIMDWDRLEMFSDGDPQEKATLIEMFTTYADESLHIMKENCAEGGSETWKKAAHKLKGSAANLGAMQLSNLCAEAEDASNKSEEDKRRMLEAVLAGYGTVCSLLQDSIVSNL